MKTNIYQDKLKQEILQKARNMLQQKHPELSLTPALEETIVELVLDTMKVNPVGFIVSDGKHQRFATDLEMAKTFEKFDWKTSVVFSLNA